MKRWLFSSFLVSLLSLSLAGAQVVALAATWVLQSEDSGSDEREEQTSRTQESRAATRKTKPRLFAILSHPVSLLLSLPLSASFHDNFVAIEVALPDKIPILRV